MKIQTGAVLAIGCLTAVVVCTASAGSFRPPKDYFYFTPGGIGTRWTHFTQYDITQPDNKRWTITEVADTVTLGVTGETLSYKVEWSESFIGSPDTTTYRTLYYTFNPNGDLCVSGAYSGSLMKFDPVWVYLRNPVTVGDSTYFSLSGSPYAVSAVVVSDTDTLQLPSGLFRNCLRIRERSWYNGQPSEVTDTRYIPVPSPYAGRGRERILHWISYPTNSRTSLSYLVNCVPVGIEANMDPVHPIPTLEQNRPNPFNPTTTVKYSIAERGHVSLRIYNAVGQLVRTLVDEEQVPQANGFSEVWNGLNEDGRPVASGVYFYRLTAGDRTLTKKMVLIR